MKNIKKIRWALDPFSSESAPIEHSVRLLEQLFGAGGIEVTPTYILGSDLTQWISYFNPQITPDTIGQVKEAMTQKIAAFQPTFKLSTPEIIDSKGFSTRSDAQTLVDAMGSHDLLLIHTRATKGISALFLGSFAESVLNRLNKPILFTSPEMSVHSPQVEKICYPTSLSLESLEVFKKFVDETHFAGKQFLIYSKVLHPASSLLSETSTLLGGAPIDLEPFLKENNEKIEMEKKKWTEFLESKGIHFSIHIDQGTQDVAEGIVDFSKSQSCDLIVMPSFATKMDTLLVGSHAKNTIRMSPIPVISWHHEVKETPTTTLYS